jgi:hypothetical protein
LNIVELYVSGELLVRAETKLVSILFKNGRSLLRKWVMFVFAVEWWTYWAVSLLKP